MRKKPSGCMAKNRGRLLSYTRVFFQKVQDTKICIKTKIIRIHMYFNLGLYLTCLMYSTILSLYTYIHIDISESHHSWFHVSSP